MVTAAFNEATWRAALVAEAKRDVVFVFNITSGAFGGPQWAPTEEAHLRLLERVSAAMLQAGCKVGFMEQGTGEVVIPEGLRVPFVSLPESIARFYAEDPERAKFLAFTLPSQPLSAT